MGWFSDDATDTKGGGDGIGGLLLNPAIKLLPIRIEVSKKLKDQYQQSNQFTEH